MASLMKALRPVATPRISPVVCGMTARMAQSPSKPTPRSFGTSTIRFAQRGQSKLYKDADAAVADVKSGSVLLSSGFGLCGVAETLIEALGKRGPEALNGLTAVSNNAGVEGKGGLSLLVKSGQVSNLILSYLGGNKTLEKKYLNGDVAIELCPQGTLGERIRAAGAGIPAFYTPTGASE